MFVAFVLTVVPFYHGMNRHLDDAYLARTPVEFSHAGILLDVFVFFVEGALFFVLATTIDNGPVFFHLLAGLLLFDAGWAACAHKARYHSDASPWPQGLLRWAGLNAVAGLALLAVSDSTVLAHPVYALMIVSGLRSALDYAINLRFYFPLAPGGESEQQRSHTSERSTGPQNGCPSIVASAE